MERAFVFLPIKRLALSALLLYAQLSPAMTIAPTTYLQMKNNGWMEHNINGPLLVSNVAAAGNVACGPKPLKSFTPHPSAPGNYYYDCDEDPWGPSLMWLAVVQFCPQGFVLSNGVAWS